MKHRTNGIVRIEELQDLANYELKLVQSDQSAKVEEGFQHGPPLDIDAWTEKYNVPIRNKGKWNDGRKWVLCSCPWNDHTDRSSYIVQLANGAIAAGCHHNSCQAYGWSELRKHYDPDCIESSVTSQAQEFPVDALPAAVRNYVEETASSLACPKDFLGVVALVALGSTIGNTYSIAIDSDWSEPPLLYAAIIAEPGSKKSPALKKAMSPISAMQNRLKTRFKSEQRQYLIDKAAWHSKNEAEDYDDICAEEPSEPTFGRVLIENITVEAMIPILEQNSRGVICAKDELAGFFNAMNQYKNGKGSDRQDWMTIWNQGMITVDRKGNKEPLSVSNPFVALIGMVQPEVIKNIRMEANDGFMDRILFSFPDCSPAYYSEFEVSDEAKATYEQVFETLSKVDVLINEEGTSNPRVLHVSPNARKAFIGYYNGLIEEIHDSACPHYMKNVLSKLMGYTLRIALILSVVEQVGKTSTLDNAALQTGDFPVNLKAMESAIKLIEYFKSHALKTYRMLNTAKKRDKEPESTDRVVPAKKIEILASSLKEFLELSGGYWEGTARKLFDELTEFGADGMPGSEAWLSKNIRELARLSEWLDLDPTFYRGKNPILKLSLASVETEPGGSTLRLVDTPVGAETRLNDVHVKRISEAIAKWAQDNPEAIRKIHISDLTTELYFFGYLGDLPEESEVKDALSQLDFVA